MSKKILCTVIGVDCVRNDPEDIKCGGPNYLGFDFNVPKGKTDEMKQFIGETLYAFGIPVVRIYNDEEDVFFDEKYVWDKTRIFNEISDEAEYLLSEAEAEAAGHYSHHK